MSLIEWNETLHLNIGEIDTQHHKLVDMINELNDAMRAGKGKEIVGKILNGLIAYAASHFKTEEHYFEKLGYSGSVKHKSEHNNFVKKVTEFQQGYQSGRIGLTTQVMNFLGDWLQNHIKGSDKQYAPFFHEQGIK